MIDILYKHPEAYFEASAIIFDLILIIFANVQTRSGKGKSRSFKVLLYVVTLLTVFEVATDGFLRDVSQDTNSCFLINLCNSLWFICVAALGFGLHEYFCNLFSIRYNRAVKWISIYILASFYIIMVANIFLGWVSKYDVENDVYVHGVLYPVGTGVLIYLYLMVVLLYFVRFKQIPNRFKFVVFMMTALVIATLFIQPFLESGIGIVGVSASLGILMLYFTVETSDHEELISATEKLEVAREEADNANAAKSVFLEDMSHEIRTPINALMGFNELILKESDNEETLMYAQDMGVAIETLLSIVSDVLDISKIESGEFTLLNEPYTLAKVIKDVEIIIRSRAETKGLDFKVEVDKNLPDELKGDETRIRQVIINILNNSVKYTKKGGIVFNVSGERDGGTANLCLTFKDTGIGIKKEDMATLFDSYQRFDVDDDNKNIEGTGLGLAIVKEIVDRLGGTIEVDSEYGVGTTFTVRFSQAIIGNKIIAEHTTVKAPVKKVQKEAKIVAPMAKVLVVDDNTMNLKVIKGLLKDTEVMVSTAEGGAEAIEVLKEDKFDIVFLDAFMPAIDGPAVFRAIKSDRNNINYSTPVIVVTADALSDSRDKFMEMGFDEYLSKPIKVDLLKNTLFRFLPDELKEERIGG